MAGGVAVVATRVGGIPEVVDDGRTGLLVAPENPRELATAIGRLLEDDVLRKELGATGRKVCEERFSTGETVRKFCEIYRDLLTPSPRG
jgi:glycosyltransferase involved in cell wall biosynthesis